MGTDSGLDANLQWIDFKPACNSQSDIVQSLEAGKSRCTSAEDGGTKSLREYLLEEWSTAPETCTICAFGGVLHLVLALHHTSMLCCCFFSLKLSWETNCIISACVSAGKKPIFPGACHHSGDYRRKQTDQHFRSAGRGMMWFISINQSYDTFFISHSQHYLSPFSSTSSLTWKNYHHGFLLSCHIRALIQRV